MEGGNLRTPQDLRLPLAVTIGSRDGTLAKDSYVQNCFVEKQVGPGDKVYVQKRPGSSVYTTFDGGAGGDTQGLWQTRGFILAAADNKLTRIVSPTSSGFSLGSAWTNTGAATWQGRWGATVTTFNNQIFVMGGLTGATALADVWASSDGGATWIQLVSAAPWGQRVLARAVTFNNRLYLIGGTDGLGNLLNDVWVTDDGVTWLQVTSAAAWTARSAFGALVFNNGIWVLGGQTSAGPVNDVWFSTDGQTWVKQLVAPGWAARNNFGHVVFQGKMWIYGGTGGAPFNDCWYTSDGLNWTQATAAAFSTARYSLGYCVYNNLMWAICGFDAVGALAQVWSSPDGITWTQVTVAFGGAARLSAFVTVAKHPTSTVGALAMFLLGGTDAVPSYYNQVWVSNINGTLGTSWNFPPPATSPRQFMQAAPINNNQYFAIKDLRGMYVWDTDSLVAVTDRNYPTTTVPGVVNLDETLYVMTPDGLIMGSAIGDPRIWPSRNFLGADYESDPGVALLKYSNFVMAIGQFTTQFFLNSGSPSQTTLRSVKNMNARIGGAFPYAAINIEDTVIWLGRMQNSKEIQVFKMAGNAMQVISTAAEERIINSWAAANSDFIFATSVKRKGHSFYVLTSVIDNLSLAYDLNTSHWAPWAITGGDSFYPFMATATDGINNYALPYGTKSISTLEAETYRDGGVNFRCKIITPLADNGTGLRKNCSGLSLICDRVASSTVTFEYSKDDYQTWSTPVTVNVDQPRVHMNRVGKYTRIAYRIIHNANTAFRAEALETEVRIGN